MFIATGHRSHLLTAVIAFASLATITFLFVVTTGRISFAVKSTLADDPVTVYHVHSASFPSITNMNTGDLSGDVFFDVLYTTILPLYCSRVDARLCASRVNKHSSDDSLYRNDTVVTQLKIEVKDAAYGPYAQCSVNEETKDYECKCVKYSWFIIPVYFECTDPRVGRNEIEKSFGSKSIFGKLCNTFGDEGTTLRTGEWDRASNDFFAIGNGHYQKTFQDSKDQRIQGANTNLWCDWTETADRIGGTWYSTLLIGLN